MEQLTISLVDPLQIVWHDKPISDFRMRKVLALLVYLAADPETAHRRETVMTLLWPGMPDTSARANLRQVLFHLRKAIPDFEATDPVGADSADEDSAGVDAEVAAGAVPLLIANRNTIQINPAAPVIIDTSQFEALLDQIQSHDHHSLLTCNQCRENLEAVVALYTGHFLADFYLDDSNEFEEWAEIERQKYLRRMLDALETLTAIAIRQQAYAVALAHAERQLELDEYREGAYQQWMETLARNGQRNEALAVYEHCRWSSAAKWLSRSSVVAMPMTPTSFVASKPRRRRLPGWNIPTSCPSTISGAIRTGPIWSCGCCAAAIC